MKECIELNNKLSIKDLVAIARYNKKIRLGDELKNRVSNNRKALLNLVENNEIIYGVTTGFGENFKKSISLKDAEKLQENIINSHATAVGDILTEEETRAIILVILNSLGKGYSGVRLDTLERLKMILNKNIYPYAPKNGSVGYLSVEAHIIRSMVGSGKIILNKMEVDSREVLGDYKLSYKEGLALISGTSSVTGLGAIAINDFIIGAKTADIIAAMTFEVLNGNVKAYDKRAMKLRNQKEQIDTAENIIKILETKSIVTNDFNKKLQDSLSLRCVPQLHGAAKNTLYNAYNVIENEINGCPDNPIIYQEAKRVEAISNGNPDSSYVGLVLDSSCIAATMIGKMSERRNNRLIDGNLSGKEWFLTNNPGLNSGLMIPQYSQAGLLNQMRILSVPAVIDNTPTCGNQEDYVAMGYNSSLKALKVASYLEYILAIELLSTYQAYNLTKNLKISKVTGLVYKFLAEKIPELSEDKFLFEYIDYIKDMIHEGLILKVVEDQIGELK